MRAPLASAVSQCCRWLWCWAPPTIPLAAELSHASRLGALLRHQVATVHAQAARAQSEAATGVGGGGGTTHGAAPGGVAVGASERLAKHMAAVQKELHTPMSSPAPSPMALSLPTPTPTPTRAPPATAPPTKAPSRHTRCRRCSLARAAQLRRRALPRGLPAAPAGASGSATGMSIWVYLSAANAALLQVSPGQQQQQWW